MKSILFYLMLFACLTSAFSSEAQEGGSIVGLNPNSPCKVNTSQKFTFGTSNQDDLDIKLEGTGVFFTSPPPVGTMFANRSLSVEVSSPTLIRLTKVPPIMAPVAIKQFTLDITRGTNVGMIIFSSESSTLPLATLRFYTPETIGDETIDGASGIICRSTAELTYKMKPVDEVTVKWLAKSPSGEPPMTMREANNTATFTGFKPDKEYTIIANFYCGTKLLKTVIRTVKTSGPCN